MKFNPTLPLALALSVGAAGAVMAQTAPTQTPTATSQPAMPSGQPQAAQTGASEAEARMSQTPAATGQTPSATGQMPSTSAQTRQTRPAAATPSMASSTAVNGNEQVRYAQQRLHAAGLYNGPEDGIMDPNTRAAIARYQQERGLRRSESLDPETLASLEGSGTTGYGSAMPPAAGAAGATSPAKSSAALNPYAGAVGGNAGKAVAR